MSYTWKRRKTDFLNGYYIEAYELRDICYDWELDPMCDCTPSRKYSRETGKWEIRIHKAYIKSDLRCIGGKWKDFLTACACHEPLATSGEISKDEAIKIWMNIKTKHIPSETVKEYFETIKA